MGMDVHGLNPKQNRKLEEFPVFHKYKTMEEQDKDDIDDDNWEGFKKKWEELDANQELKQQYFSESDDYEKANPGYYFRNNVWWWRPLWDFCYQFTGGIISEELWGKGHHNSGHGLDAEGAKKLGYELMRLIGDGTAMRHEEQYNIAMEKRKKEAKIIGKDDFSTHYPFDTRKVEEFAIFCIESGGFEIC